MKCGRHYDDLNIYVSLQQRLQKLTWMPVLERAWLLELDALSDFLL